MTYSNATSPRGTEIQFRDWREREKERERERERERGRERERERVGSNMPEYNMSNYT